MPLKRYKTSCIYYRVFVWNESKIRIFPGTHRFLFHPQPIKLPLWPVSRNSETKDTLCVWTGFCATLINIHERSPPTQFRPLFPLPSSRGLPSLSRALRAFLCLLGPWYSGLAGTAADGCPSLLLLPPPKSATSTLDSSVSGH